MDIYVNNAKRDAAPEVLDEIRTLMVFELWIEIEDGPRLCMLRNGADAWLMYLREVGDSGFVSSGDPAVEGEASYTLSNGQVDLYPRAWCIPVEQCFRAIEAFRDGDGMRPVDVVWLES